MSVKLTKQNGNLDPADVNPEARIVKPNAAKCGGRSPDPPPGGRLRKANPVAGGAVKDGRFSARPGKGTSFSRAIQSGKDVALVP